MIALIQRVKWAKVEVEQQVIGQIDTGLLVLLGIEQGDDQTKADRLLNKVLAYRIFADNEQKMNLNVQQANGSLLIVSQFTLAADTQKGLRPSFSSSASPAIAESLYTYFHQEAEKRICTQTGKFGADMQVSLQNDVLDVVALKV